MDYCKHLYKHVSTDSKSQTCMNPLCAAVWVRESIYDPWPQEPTTPPKYLTAKTVEKKPPVGAAENNVPGTSTPTPADPEIEFTTPVASSIPPKPKAKDSFALHKYYEENRAAIIADYEKMRHKDFMARWGLAAGTWPKLQKDWDVPFKQPNRSHKNRKAKPVAKATPQREVREPRLKPPKPSTCIPSLPPYDSKWSELEQVLWMHDVVTLNIVEKYEPGVRCRSS